MTTLPSELEFLEAALGSIDARVYVLESSRRYVYVNARAAAGFGLTVPEVIGRSISEIGFSAPLVAKLESLLTTVLRDRVTQRGELQNLGRTYDFTFTPLPDSTGAVNAAVFVARDVTRERTARDHADYLAELGNALALSLDDAAIPLEIARRAVPRIADWALVDVLGPEGTLVRAASVHLDPERMELGQAFIRKHPPESLRSGLLLPVLHTGVPRFVPEIRESDLAALSDPKLADGIRVLALRSVIVVPITARGQNLGVLTLAMAESERRFTEADLRFAVELGRRAGVGVDNAQLYREAQASSRLKDEFLAILSHELRTPLTAIVGWTSLLRSGRLTPEKRLRAEETIARNADVQRQLVDDLLDVSRIISGKLRLDLTPLALNPAVANALDSVRPTADAKGVRLRVALAPEAVEVRGDAARLQQIAWNLLTNAIKFTPAGGLVEITLSRAATDRGDMAELTVEDTGAGIEPAFLPHLFERFRQADASVTRMHGGLGLGLSITRHLTEAHGGTIAAHSEGPGRGARFTLRLPALPPREDPALPAAPLPPERFDLSGVTVLVVEDAEDTRDLISIVLERAAATVRTAGNARDAWSLFRTSRPDIVLSDLGLPGTGGLELIGWIRALPESEGGTLPAVALTALVRPEDREAALQAGFTAFLKKPVDLAELLESVARLCGRARG